jgi:hypothetical protein
MDIQWQGIVIGVVTFLIIGIMHPVVIKGEYHFSIKIWPVFLVVGLACVAGSLFIPNVILSSALAVLGFSFLWGVGELREQKNRVEKGWFPENPKRKRRE